MSIHELQARLRALDEARKARSECDASMWALASVKVDEAEWEAEQAARRVAEAAGEPVAWQARYEHRDGGWSRWWDFVDQKAMDDEEAEFRRRGRAVEKRVLFTTPPSDGALVEALGKLSAEWRKYSRARAWDEFEAGSNQRCDLCADALDAALAAHKENTDGR